MILSRADVGEDVAWRVEAAHEAVGPPDADRRLGWRQFQPPRRASRRRRMSWSAAMPFWRAYSVGVRPPKSGLALRIFIQPSAKVSSGKRMRSALKIPRIRETRTSVSYGSVASILLFHEYS